MEQRPLVSVIVPAWNAEATLGETLASVAAQSWRELEIIVVDDGSTDGTARVAADFVAREPRARLLQTANGGVAAARNHAIAAATGAYVAPIDADDLWHPRYIETVVERMRAALERPAFGYAACRLIDPDGKLIGSGLDARVEGWAIQRLLFCNFVGNGSGIVIDREALKAAGGYDPRLHQAGCQGYEDYLLQLMLASAGPIAAAGEYLVGYRQLPDAMSRNLARMNASAVLARQFHRDRFPQLRPSRRLRRWIEGYRLLLEALAARGAGIPGAAALLIARAMVIDPRGTATALWGRLTGGRRPETVARARILFLDADPARADGGGMDGETLAPGPYVRLLLRRLALLRYTETPHG